MLSFKHELIDWITFSTEIFLSSSWQLSVANRFYYVEARYRQWGLCRQYRQAV